MIIVFDEDIPRHFLPYFQERGFKVFDIRDHDLRGSNDKKIIQFAIEKGAILLTGDIGIISSLKIPEGQQKIRGVILNRLPQNILFSTRLEELQRLLKILAPEDFIGYITVFEVGRIRKHRL